MHIYTALSGYGIRVVPKTAPYRYSLGPSGSVDVGRQLGDEWHVARIDPLSGDPQKSPGAADIVDVEPGPSWTEWWLETSVFRVPLPVGWVAVSAEGLCPFDLLGPSESLIFIQSPARLPPLLEMRTPEQVVVGSGGDTSSGWLEVRYEMGGAEWRQRHQVLRDRGRNLVLTAQARAHDMPATVFVQSHLASRLVAGDGEPA